MTENVAQWWARRQWSKGADVPYEVGLYRADWAKYPVLARQYHPEYNNGVVLSQVPPAADVYLLWQCDVGHLFVATPLEQRMRPGATRRRSVWCPECTEGATRRRLARATVAVISEKEPARHTCGHRIAPVSRDVLGGGRSCPAQQQACSVCAALVGSGWSRAALAAAAGGASADALLEETDIEAVHTWICGRGHPHYRLKIARFIAGRRCPICRHALAGADAVAVGGAFVSSWAPAPASAAEARLRQRFADGFLFDLAPTAVRVARPFFEHVEVWPDIVLGEIEVAIEYDTIGRDGLEHLGRREAVDRRKDRRLREVGWEVVRVRCAPLSRLGPYDVLAPGSGAVSGAVFEQVVDALRLIRGDLLVDCYLR